MKDIHVLIIDDEKNILTTLKQSLELEGYHVNVAGSGEIGLEKITSNKTDIVLLDLKLPGIDGIETLRRIKAKKPILPVIMISGHASINNAVDAIKQGAADFIEKPISPDKTLLTIRNVLKLSMLSEGNKLLKEELDNRYKIIGESRAIKELLEKVDAAAPSKSRVLITGQSGTGKELIARRIHFNSDRSSRPFVKVNCAAIPSELIESELFGHKKGSFTGAISDREGKFKKADSGTLFLDEIGDMKLEMQAKLLRVLQENEFEPIGSDQTIKVDVRVIAATNKDIKKEVSEGRFREDLFYRLNVIPVYVPTLEERIEDIELLAVHFLRIACEENNRQLKTMNEETLEYLKQQRWPGNIRQFKNLCEQMVIMTAGQEIGKNDLKKYFSADNSGNPTTNFSKAGPSLKDMINEAEKKIIINFLKKNNWNMAATAAELQLERSHLYKKCKSLGIEYQIEDK